ncbi:MAG: helix-turn-helix transcriptional regulator [Clostridia bacterium]|nr:helix-turn-helix transcriptional regulator [Clostridia bacterium]
MDYIDFFYNRLTQLRLEKGVSSRDMSLSLGQSESYINKIENRRTLPSLTGFFFICEYFGISPSEFFNTDNQSPVSANHLLSEIQKLSNEHSEHILQIVKDINALTN